MSCHDIGHGLNNVVKAIINKLESGEMATCTGKDLIRVCRDSVHFCDGNTYEALECLEEEGRCSCCLVEYGKDNLIDCYGPPNDLEYMGRYLYDNAYGKDILGAYVCRSCAKKLYDRYLKNKKIENTD